MSKKYAQGVFTPKNPQKYVGNSPPYARSSWEFAVMRMCDSHPSVVRWASEMVKIPYHNPITNRTANYVPDFLIEYIDSKGQTRVELIEVKPNSQSTLESARSKYNKTQLAVNASKWQQAQKWCEAKGIRFRVITENEIFRNPKKRK